MIDTALVKLPLSLYDRLKAQADAHDMSIIEYLDTFLPLDMDYGI